MWKIEERLRFQLEKEVIILRFTVNLRLVQVALFGRTPVELTRSPLLGSVPKWLRLRRR